MHKKMDISGIASQGQNMQVNRFMKKIGEIPQSVMLGATMAICLLYRIYFFGYLNPNMVLYNSDSVSYFAPVDILRGTVDLYRTPLYSMVIEFFEYLSKENLVSNLILFQQVVSFLSIIPFFYVSEKIIRNRFFSVAATLFYGLWHPILIQNVHLNPESLCFAGSVLLLFILVSYLERPRKPAALALGVFPFFLVMLKPTYLITLGVVLMLFVTRYFVLREERKILYWGFAGILLSVLGTVGYCAMNYRHNGQFVLSNIALNNTIAHISISGAYDYGKDDELMAIIDRTRHINYYAAPFTINNHFIDNYKICEKRFPKNLPPTTDMIFCLRMPDTVNYPPERIKRFIRNSQCTMVYAKYMLKRLFDIVVAAYGGLFLLLLFQSLVLAHVFVKHKEIGWAQVFCILFVLGQFISIWLAGLDDMDRHLIPSYPFFIQIAGAFGMAVTAIFKKEGLRGLMVR
ncbi:MAG TPA: hypothetical protein PLT45_03650 [Smithella sp.]|nr:hypothetical protein [Smithella sp.]